MEYIKQIKKHSREDPRYMMFSRDDVVRFHWDIIMVCNYNCEYCYARDSEHWGDINTRINITNVLEKISKINKLVEVVLLGGEPTLSPFYTYILDYLYKLPNLNLFGCISNNKANIERNIKIHSKYKDKFNWNITYHPTQLKNDKEIKEFKDKLLLIKNNDFILNVNIMLSSEKEKNNIYDMVEFCLKNNIPFYYNVIFDHCGSDYMCYSEPYRDFLREVTTRYKNVPKELHYYRPDGTFDRFDDVDAYLRDLSCFKGWKCRNNNIDIRVESSDFIHFCKWQPISVEEINAGIPDMICPLDKCLCQGKLTKLKYKI